MIGNYPARYIDKNGEVRTVIHIDGRILHVQLRGVDFIGYDFDGLEADHKADRGKLKTFTLQSGELCACIIECELSIDVLIDGQTRKGILDTQLELGNPANNGGLDKEILNLTLRYEDKIIRSSGMSGWFEGELLDIQRNMPSGHHLKICFGCAFSDYSPYGHGLFGNMYCFRGNKEEYLRVKSKNELFAIWHTAEEEPVQETYVCPEFQIRKEGTGYRG